MLSTYPACFIKEESGYSVIFTDLNYLATCGDTFEEAYSMAVDCLSGYIYELQQGNEMIPPASPVTKINVEKLKKDLGIECEEYFVNIVAVDVEEYAKTHFEKSVKKTLTIPVWLNKAAIEQNINFSQVLQEALKKKLFSK